MSAAYVAYFDASGHSNRQKVVTVAGFVSTVKKRARFDIEWNAFLENEGIDIFHMTDFASSQRQFAGWKGQSDRRRVFIEQLVQCVRKNVNKAFRTSLLIDDFNEVNRIFGLEETIGRPYAVCGRQCLHSVCLWAKRKNAEGQLRCYFEDGDKDKGNFEENAKTWGKIKPMFLPKERAAAFQACDFAGWKYRTSITNALANDHTREKGMRLLDSVAALRAIPSKGGAGVLNRASLLEFCRRFRVPPRQAHTGSTA